MHMYTEGTVKQSYRGRLGHCLLYIQRALATRRMGGRLGTEDIDNQTDRGKAHSGVHWGAVNCTFRGHR